MKKVTRNAVIVMVTLPRDQAHWPLTGQTVELIPWAAVLPNGQKIAELSGHLSKVQGSYNPNTHSFTLATPPPAGFGAGWKTRSDSAALANEGEFFYLRLWNRGADTTSPEQIPFAAGTSVSLGNTGLKVTFTGTQFRAADFWIVAARPQTPELVVPWELSTGRAAHGVHRWLAPLGVIHRALNPGSGMMEGTIADDCRPTFAPLTRLRTCCTYTVGDNLLSFGHFDSIQQAILHLPAEGGEVCILPGTYHENLELNDLRNVTLHRCGMRSRLIGLPALAGGIAVIGGQNITIESLAIEAHENGPGVVLEGADPNFQKDDQHPDLKGALLADLPADGCRRSCHPYRSCP